MKKALVRIVGQSEYAQSKFHGTEKLPREGADDYEQRTWRERAHYDAEGNVKIPALAFKKCIAEAAKYLSLQIPGKGKATYTKNFQSGILVVQDVPVAYNGKPVTMSMLDEPKSGFYGKRMFVPADGVAGSGKRVHRIHPVIDVGWTAEFEFLILDDIITQDVFQKHLEIAGMLIGVGAFRVRNGGIMGRFQADIINWQEDEG